MAYTTVLKWSVLSKKIDSMTERELLEAIVAERASARNSVQIALRLHQRFNVLRRRREQAMLSNISFKPQQIAALLTPKASPQLVKGA